MNNLKRPKPDNVLVLHETALKDFLYLCDQRLKFIRFYMIVLGLVLSAVTIFANQNPEPRHIILSFLFGIVLVIVTYVFQGFDKRNREIINITQEALKDFEQWCDQGEQDSIVNKLSIFTIEDNKKSNLKIGERLGYIFYLGYTIAVIFIVLSIYLGIEMICQC